MLAPTVTEYLAALPADRREALSEVRRGINQALPPGYKEGIQFGMISITFQGQREPVETQLPSLQRYNMPSMQHEPPSDTVWPLHEQLWAAALAGCVENQTTNAVTKTPTSTVN
jgi:hypothetical protein